MPRYTIDRFEGDDWVVLEDDRAQTFRIPRHWVPAGAREGDLLNASGERGDPAVQSLRFELDPAAREHRRAEADRLRDQLPRGPKGDISL